MIKKEKMRWQWLAGLTASLLIVFASLTAYAGEMVRGRYVSAKGNRIVLELEIASPPPYSLIVEQFLPAGIDIVTSQPGTIKFNSKKGRAKWLLKKVKPGKMQFVMELSDSIGADQVRAEVLCRDKKTGEMTELVITP